MKHLVAILFLLFGTTGLLIAQTTREHSEIDDEKGVYELITSGIYAYSPEHEEGSFGTELHFTYWFNHRYGSGLSYTAKFEEEATVHDIALLGSWNPTLWLTVNVGPNFSLPNDTRDFALSLYGETEINIRVNKWFHFGPLFGFILGENSEITTGLQLGFEIR